MNGLLTEWKNLLSIIAYPSRPRLAMLVPCSQLLDSQDEYTCYASFFKAYFVCTGGGEAAW